MTAERFPAQLVDLQETQHYWAFHSLLFLCQSDDSQMFGLKETVHPIIHPSKPV